MDFDYIVREWFYRLPKGYADAPYTEEELRVLGDVLTEQGISLNKILPRNKKSITEANIPANEIIADIEETINASGISKTAVQQMVQHLKKIPENELNVFYDSHFRKYTLDDYINDAYKYFEDYFTFKGDKQGTGRGELMAVMAITGASSGGTEEKDLKLDDGSVWEVKEGPDTIRMAKSGFAGLFDYVDEIKQFYKYLEIIKLDDRLNDENLIDLLKSAFDDDNLAKKVFDVLSKNFRGDGFKATKADLEDPDAAANTLNEKNFFYRIKVAAELPAGAIQLHWDGFEYLRTIKDRLLKNSALLKNAKMLVKTKDIESEFWISAADAERIKNADSDSDVTIKKGVPTIDENFSQFMFNLIKIFNHTYVKNPVAISDSFTERKREYFSEGGMQGILWYEKGSPIPHLGYDEDFVVYGISQNMGKLARREKFKGKGYDWIDNQK